MPLIDVSSGALKSPGGTPYKVVLIAREETEAENVREIFRDRPGMLFWRPSVKEALAMLERHAVAAVLFCADQAECRWQEVFAALNRLERPPNLVVASAFADERVWAEVLNLGAFDLLLMPFDRREFLQVIEAACRRWGDPRTAAVSV